MVFEGLLLVVALIVMALWAWMLVDCVTRESDQGNTKLIWVLIILFGNFVGALMYLFVRRPQRWAELGR